MVEIVYRSLIVEWTKQVQCGWRAVLWRKRRLCRVYVLWAFVAYFRDFDFVFKGKWVYPKAINTGNYIVILAF